MITCDSESCPLYQPGVWSQDMVTLPVEIALAVGVPHLLSPPKTPRWPFQNERADAKREPTRQPGTISLALGSAVAGPLIGKLAMDSRVPFWPHARGALHAHLLTEIATVGAKETFGRKRPFYDRVASRGKERADDRYSFFSGHASHAFTFATYGSYLSMQYLDNPVSRWAFTGALYGVATWVAASRAVDRQHYWSDVLVGAGVGTGVAYFVASRTDDLANSSLSVRATASTLGLEWKF